MDHFLSTYEVAMRLGLDRTTVLRYLRSGKLVGSRVNGAYRIAESAVAEFLTSSAFPAMGLHQASFPDRLLSAREAAMRLAVDPKTVVRYVKSGKLRGSRIGGVYRIRESSVLALTNTTSARLPNRRRATVTAFVNQRAGSGKTTTVRNVATALHDAGERVLAIDLDPQAGLSSSFDVPPSTLTASVYQALLDDGLDPFSVMRQTRSGIDLLPATIDLAVAEVELVNMMHRELMVRDLVHKLRPDYGHILIDTASHLGLLTITADCAKVDLMREWWGEAVLRRPP